MKIKKKRIKDNEKILQEISPIIRNEITILPADEPRSTPISHTIFERIGRALSIERPSGRPDRK